MTHRLQVALSNEPAVELLGETHAEHGERNKESRQAQFRLRQECTVAQRIANVTASVPATLVAAMNKNPINSRAAADAVVRALGMDQSKRPVDTETAIATTEAKSANRPKSSAA